MAWTRSSSRSMRRPRAERDSGWEPIADGECHERGIGKNAGPPGHRTGQPVPCRSGDSWLWFAQNPDDLEEAKARCRRCPLRVPCLAGAAERREPCGVWGGEIFDQGTIVAVKRRRGRPHADAGWPPGRGEPGRAELHTVITHSDVHSLWTSYGAAEIGR